MSKLELINICHTYECGPCDTLPSKQSLEDKYVIKDINLTWESGSANALLGPSGCGKTTILNIISGLLEPSFGKILLDGKDVTKLGPEERRIAQIFQFPVVYDTLSVFANLAFPLKNAGMDRTYIKNRVEEIADILDLTHLLSKTSGKISQAEKQKVSLGRGIVREDTAAILLDEPLTVLDPKEKYILRRKLREVQRKLKITMIYVTHDQHEALTFADSVSVNRGGVIIQTGSPAELHSEPKDPFIGYFIGSPGMNLLDCTLQDQQFTFRDFSYPIPPTVAAKLNGEVKKCSFGIRPEFVIPANRSKGEPSVEMSVDIIERLGAFKILNLTRDDSKIQSRVPDTFEISEGDTLPICFPEKHIKIFCGNSRVY
jgi:glycerol transport system ATP-binding protein